MPLYEYESLETGATVDLMRPVEDRNKSVRINGVFYQRVKFIPDRLIVFGTQPTKEQAFDKKILQGYYRKEEREGSRFRSGYTKKQLAKVYAEAKSL